MSVTLTTRLGLVKVTPGTGQAVDVQAQLNAAWDKIDSFIGATICTSSTRPLTPFDGQIIRETDTRRVYVRNATQSSWDQVMVTGGTWGGSLSVAGTLTVTGGLVDGSLTRFRTTDSAPRNNSTSLLNDSDLVIPVAANAKYVMDGFFLYTSNATADINFQFVGPASSTLSWSAWGQGTTATTFEGSIKNERRSIAQNSAHGGTSSDLSVRPVGFLQTAGASGNLQLTWGQNTATVVDTKLLVGSWLRLHRVS